MNNDEYQLYLDISDSNNLVIIKSQNLDKEDWAMFRKEFTGEPDFKEESQFYISFELFYQKKSYLIEWHRKGFSYFLSEKLREKTRKKKQDISIFKKSLLNTSEPENFSLDHLKLKRTLTTKQYQNVCYMLSKENMANFSVPGAGKTMTSLVVWKYLNKKKTVNKLLVICPKSAFDAWQYEEPYETFEGSIFTQALDVEEVIREKSDILIINYEKLENNRVLSNLELWIKNNNAMIIIDEAHRIKGGSNSVRWHSCKRLSNFAKRIDILTGTPMPQGYDDLRNLLNISWKNIPANYFTDNLLASLKRGSVYVRTTKSELNLPKINFIQEFIPPGKFQKSIYDALKKEYAGLLKISDNSEDFFKRKGRAAMTLIAAATNPGLIVGKEKEDAYLNLQWPPREIREDKDLLEELEEYVQIETPSKYKWLISFLRKQKKKNKKTLVWSSFIGNIIALERLLKKEFDPAIIYGKYSQEERKLALKKFKDSVNCFVLITNPQTLGEGISLHKVCNDAVYIDRTYNAGQYLQSVDRIHRLGLSRETITNIFILLTKGTIDSKVHHRLEEKITRMYEMLNDNDLPIHELNSNDTSLYNSFDNKDIDDFLNHLINND